MLQSCFSHPCVTYNANIICWLQHIYLAKLIYGFKFEVLQSCSISLLGGGVFLFLTLAMAIRSASNSHHCSQGIFILCLKPTSDTNVMLWTSWLDPNNGDSSRSTKAYV